MSIRTMTGYNYKWNFNPNANDDFIVSDVATLLNHDTLRDLIEQHKVNQLPRLEFLEAYYLNQNQDILAGQRRVDDNSQKADHRATNNYARFISQFIVGYMTGNPITFTHNDEEAQQVLRDLNDFNDSDAVDSELALNLSIYGRAYEIVFRNEDGEDKFLPLDPKSTFVVYNNDIDKKVLAGVRYYTLRDSNGYLVEYADVYTSNKIYSVRMREGKYEEYNESPHYFNDVPIIEYVNDKFKQGDFENVISLIDLYDAAQSDTANYMTDLNDAVLVIIGGDDLDSEDAVRWRQANMVHLQPALTSAGTEGKADAKYIYKQYDVQGSEAYKQRLEDDIHKFSNTPDLSDKAFGGNQSGEAMKYKLFGLEQKMATKMRYFKKGLMKRYKLLFTLKNIESSRKLDYSDVNVQFSPNLPKAIKESVDIFNALNGGVSEKTRLALLDFIDNPDEELEQMKKEELDYRKATDQSDYPTE